MNLWSRLHTGPSLAAVVLLGAICGAAPGDETLWAPEEVAFFETRIRPVLIEKCYRCHSAEAAEKNQLKGGLLVDSREGLLQGGDSGPALEPGQPEASLLLQSLRYESLEMPPDGRLPAAVISDFARWIERGAADPRTTASPLPARTIDIAAGREHWAYRPLTVPPVRPGDLPEAASPIDAFIDRGLREQQLSPVPEADRVTLARRLSFDLLGLPPKPERIDAFVADDSPLAYERYVDELLASPQFGVRWGRHWLDIVRFAESVTLRGLVQHEAWRYRDYVVDAFNLDLPYNQFLREQVAGDLLPAESVDQARRRCIATAFLTLTDANLEEQDKQQLRMDVVDEQLGVIGEALLGQTIGCARCHDHKFDPIPTADYYAMAAILRNTRTMEHANVSRWIERPLPLPPAEAEVAARQAAEIERLKRELAALNRRPVPRPKQTVLASTLAGIILDDEQATFVGAWKPSISIKPYVEAGYRHDENSGQGEKSATFRTLLPEPGMYEVRLSYTTGANRSQVVHVTLTSADGESTQTINQRQPPPIDGLFVSLGKHRFTADESAQVMISNREATGVVIVDAVQFLPVDGTLAAANGDASAPAAEIDSAESQSRMQELEQEIKTLEAALALAPRFQGVHEEPEIGDTHVHIRGVVHNLGPRVPRGFLQVVDVPAAFEFTTQESGRRQLGDWLADPANPLPARVYANRIWHWLFGVGLVATTDNFGTTGQPPTHPELLDYLAGRLIERGWSTKALIREIVLSQAYRRQSLAAPGPGAADPENRWLWRMNRKPLEAECLLDAVLSVSGEIDLALGGKTLPDKLSADYTFQHNSTRRALYWPQLRNSRPRLLVVFDGANPSLVTGRRNTSSVAPQALHLLNDPWILDQSQQTARRLLADEGLSDSLRIQQAFRLCIGRLPTEAEERLAAESVGDVADGDAAARLKCWSQLVHALICSLDFRFLD